MEQTLVNSIKQVKNLLCPDNAVIIGASGRPNNWSQIAWKNLNRLGFSKPVYLVNPRYDTLWDQPCYPSIDQLPEKPDHLLLNVPAKAVISALEEGAKAGARSATIFAGGFGEGGDPAGALLHNQLKEVIDRTGLAVSGPNCLGNLCARSGLVTITESSVNNIKKLSTSSIAIVGQSGGVVPAINRSLTERGMPQAGYMITTGNEIGLSMADYIHYLVQDDDVKVILSFMESIKNTDQFLSACREARKAGKPIVVMKVGGTEAGKKAALAHTGSLTGSIEAFDAVACKAGVIRVNNLDELVETVEFLVHGHLPTGTGIGAITFSGAVKGMLMESAERSGFSFPKLSPETEQKLRVLLPVGTSIGNPLDSGFGALSSQDIYFTCIDLLLEDPHIDVLMIQEELPRYSVPWKEDNLTKLNMKAEKGLKKPIAIFSMISHGQSEQSLSLRRQLPTLPFLQEVDKSLRAVKAVVDYSHNGALGNEKGISYDSQLERKKAVEAMIQNAEAAESGDLITLNEVDSKQILKQYGIPILGHMISGSAPEAVEAAGTIGYPVVLKGISATFTHKTDAGIVKVGLKSGDEVMAAFQEISERLRNNGERNCRVLVEPFMSKGQEVVLGVHRDPEMGLVMMFGSGGIWLELFKDVAFHEIPFTKSQAMEMIRKTKAGKLLEGFRGAPRDMEIVVAALEGLSHLAYDLRDQLESIEINPFSVLERGKGGFALDGLIVLKK